MMMMTTAAATAEPTEGLRPLLAPNNSLAFKKMHGLGNDFVMLKASQLPSLEPRFLSKLACLLCDRHWGIGGDGLIVAAPSQHPAAYDIEFIYYNGDGTPSQMCGNGIRCFAQFAKAEGLVTKDQFIAKTGAGLLECTLLPDNQVRVNMGLPVLNPAFVPFVAVENETDDLTFKSPKTLQEGDYTYPIWPVSMGNPHLVVFQEDVKTGPLEPSMVGPRWEKHLQFPEKTNVEFVTVEGPNTLKVVVWERGCGFTQACGTGACAVGVAAMLAGKVPLGQPLQVKLPGGMLGIEWEGTPQSPVWMSGPAVLSFEGSLPNAYWQKAL